MPRPVDRVETPASDPTQTTRPRHQRPIDRIMSLTLADVAFGVLLIAALTSTWVALAGSLQIVDACIAIAAVCTLIHCLTSGGFPRLPRWLSITVIGVLALMVVQALSPTSETYMNSRSVLTVFPRSDSATESLTSGGQWLVALLVLPLVATIAVGGRIESAEKLGRFWMFGAVLSCIVAVLDFAAGTGINQSLTGIVNYAGRESGLAVHPNNLGIAAALAIPFAVIYASRKRLFGVACVVLLGLGAYVSGSRAAQGAAVLALALTFLLVQKSRKGFVRVLIVGIAGAAFVVTAFPQLVAQATGLFRFSSSNAGESDLERALVYTQGLRDFQERPFRGVGLEVIKDAHNMGVQILAAGGIALMVIVVVFFVGAIWQSARMLRGGLPIAGAVLVSSLTWLALGAFSNQLTDRYLYFGIAILAALSTLPLLARSTERGRRRRRATSRR